MSDMRVPYGVVYVATCIPTGKKYVGATKTTAFLRWRVHCYEAKNIYETSALSVAIRKYGKSAFDVQDVAVAVSEADLFATESIVIWQEKSGVPNGLNTQPPNWKHLMDAETYLAHINAVIARSNLKQRNAYHARKRICNADAAVREVASERVSRHRRRQTEQLEALRAALRRIATVRTLREAREIAGAAVTTP
jgi:hypothetical protein